MELINYNRDVIFTTKLPVPNRVMFPIEKSGKNNYGNRSMIHLVDAVRIIQEGEVKQDTQRQAQQESRMVKAMELFISFISITLRKSSVPKMARLDSTYLAADGISLRAVIGSIYSPHDFREVHFPWAVAMEQFYMQIANKLIKRGHSLDEINGLMRKHATVYSEYIDEIFKELIDESPYIGLPIIFQRNPTIRRPSAILVYVTKIKTNADDHTIAASVGNLTGMNADFDGDALNNVHLQDIDSHDNFVCLSPEWNVMDLSVPWGYLCNLKLQPPVVSTTANWLLHGRRKAYGENYASGNLKASS